MTGTGFVVDCALIKAEHTCFSDGAVQWTIKAGDTEQCPAPLGGKQLMSDFTSVYVGLLDLELVVVHVKVSVLF